MLISLFHPLLWITAGKKNQAEEITWTIKSGGTQHHKHIQTAADYWSAIAIMLMIFWTECGFCIISDKFYKVVFSLKWKKNHQRCKSPKNNTNSSHNKRYKKNNEKEGKWKTKNIRRV